MGLDTDAEQRPVPEQRRPWPASPRPLPAVTRLSRGPAGLLVIVAIVTTQVLANYHAGDISDLKSLFYAHRLAHHPVPYIDVPIQYPVLIGLFMTGAAAITHDLHDYLLASSLGLWVCAVGCAGALWGVSRRAAWCFAMSPLLLVYSLLNWDMLAIFLMALGWLAWSRNRYGTAAALMTLGVFTKLYPVFLLFFCAVELVRRRRDGEATPRDLMRFGAAALIAAAVVNLPFVILAFHNWSYFWTYNSSRTNHADLLSWLGPLEHAPAATANDVLIAVIAVSVALGITTIWRRRSPVHVAAVTFFVYMLFQKINSPQYTLWLVVYAAIDEWPLWTIVALSLMGLADYANAVINIELVDRHQRGLAYWYVQHFYFNDQGLRLVTTLVTLVAVVARRDLGWPGPAPPPAQRS